MANSHRTSVLVSSCLKTPVDPHTKAPLASYERRGVPPGSETGHLDNRDYEKELEYEDSESDLCDEDCLEKAGPHMRSSYRGGRLNLTEIFFSNEEYYSKLDELKKAHHHTMAELENTYQQKLQLRSTKPPDETAVDGGHRLPWVNTSPAASRRRLRKSHSAAEVRWDSGHSDSSDETKGGSNDVEKGLLFSPKEYIKNMWKDFKVSPHSHQLSSSLPHGLSEDLNSPQKGTKRHGSEAGQQENRKPKVTVPKPFHMMLREAERQKWGTKTHSEIELENTNLKRQLEELTECQRKFRASPVPAHVHLPLYEELQERNEERRRTMRERDQQHLQTIQKPFSFLERERRKKEQKQQQHSADQEKVKPFKAQPVPKSVYAAASGDQMKEEQLYRSIKIQMRAQEMLHSASLPPSMLTRRLSERKKTRDESTVTKDAHTPQINKEVPDFKASHRRFQRQLEKRKEVKSTTACEPFELRTSQISSHRERILADIEKDQSSPRMLRWPYVGPGSARTPNSSLCSSLSGSMELLPAKVTDATKKRHDAVRKVLEQRKKAEEEEERWKEKQRQREKRLQRVVQKRAQANDPHLALSQTHQGKLKEFRKQDLQRNKEYKQEIREMHERVKGRPLLLEQVAQRNAKQAAERRYIEALHGCDVMEDFITSKAAKSASDRKTPLSSDSKHSNQEDGDHGPVHYRRIFLDDEDVDDPAEREGGNEEEEARDRASLNQEDEDAGSHHSGVGYRGDDPNYSDESYSEDDEIYSDNSEHETDFRQQEAGK